MIYLQLFWEFLKTGLFTVGGGLASLPFLYEISDKTGWYTHAQLADMIAISESTPGPIAINCATYVGQKQAGIPGSVVATVGLVVPSFVIIYIISLFFDAFLSFKLVEYAFRGIQVCVVYLIFSAGIKMLTQMKKTALSVTIVSSVVVCMLLFSLLAWKFSTILYILICGVLGLVLYLLRQMKEKKEGTR